MAQTIIVDISTRGANPVAYTHQGDTGRTFFAEIYENGEAFAVAGYTIKVGAILPANRGYTVIAGNDMVTATKTNDNTTNKIYFTLSDKYSLKAGNGILTLIFTSNTGTPSTIRPINIDLRIQKSADADDTIAGASDFPEGLESIAESVFQEYLSTYLPPVAPSSSAAANKAADAKLTGEALDDLKSDLNKISEKSVNLMPITEKATTVNGVSFTYADGILNISGTATASGGRTTPLTDSFVLPAGTYTLSRNNDAFSVFIMSGTSAVLYLMGPTTTMTATLDSPTTCYLGANVVSGESLNVSVELQLEENTFATDFVFPSEITAFDKVSRDYIDDIGLPYEAPELTWTSGKAFIYNNGWTNNIGYSYADINLIQGQSLDITMYCSTVVYPLSVWSSDGTSIIKACFDVAGESGVKHFIYPCSAQSEMVRINVDSNYKTSVIAKIYKPDNQVNVSNIATNNHGSECFDVLHTNIIAIGDSLTQGSYTGYDLHENQSYPAFLAKKMGNTVVNAGRSGWSTQQWWKGDSTTQKGFPYYTYSDYDTAVICLGTNGGLTDTLDADVNPYSNYTDYANTNTGCYCKIIEGIKAQNPSINILLCNIWSSNGTGGRAATNAVIDKIATKYNLPVIDLYSEFISLYTVYHAVSNNIHLGRIGYARMADIIRQAINNNVLNKPTNYNYIPS